MLPVQRVVVSIDNAINDAVGLDKEINVHRRVDISQEVLVYGHKQFHISMVVYSAPNRAKLMVDVLQIALIL